MTELTLANPGILRIAYAANIFILVPVCWGMIAPTAAVTVFQGAVTESSGLRLLVFSLWSAILAASIYGLFAPAFFAPLLLVQIFYKTLWLALFVWPAVRSGAPVPWGIAGTFAAIVVVWPVLLVLALRG